MVKAPEVAELSDQSLSHSDVEDEAAAFEAELAPLLLPARRLAVVMLLDSDLAEDAVQEAALRAWEHRRTRRPGSDLGPWLFGIVANCCRQSRRSRWARVLRVPDPQPVVAAPPMDDSSGLDLRRAVATLPKKARLALALRFYLDLPYAQIAVALGCSVNAAKVRVSRAVAALRASLDASEVTR